MTADPVETLLRSSIGLDPASIGRSAIERAIRERERVCLLDDRGAYWDRLRQSEEELQALIEAVVVSETWFFRDPEAFVALRGLVRERLARRLTVDPIRILSLPCSTGEEPYSMVMALLDDGLALEGVHVHGVDVSHRVLAHARLGIYGTSSFRGAAPGWRSRYFTRSRAGEQICDRVRHGVSFQQGNLLRRSSLAGAAPYDVVFCRNVLIYFDRAAQETAVDVLHGLLAPNGVLVVGAAEAGVLTHRAFVPAKLPNLAAFRRTADAPARPPRKARPVAAAAPPRRVAALPAPERLTAVAPPAVEADEAMRLADQGRFTEAAAWCEAYLGRHAPSAQVFHVLGLVRDAAGNHAAAATCYRKALYLDPRHHEALVHLALLMEMQHNGTEAELLRQRARRVAGAGN